MLKLNQKVLPTGKHPIPPKHSQRLYPNPVFIPKDYQMKLMCF